MKSWDKRDAKTIWAAAALITEFWDTSESSDVGIVGAVFCDIVGWTGLVVSGGELACELVVRPPQERARWYR